MPYALTARYLAAVDHALPGLVDALYLTGSVALGGYQPGLSDVDTLIVTSRTLTTADLATLAAVHAGMPDAPHLDGVYLDQAQLAAQPDDRPVVPFVVNGEFRTDRRCGELNPVLWLTLRRYGLSVRGPAIADLRLRDDPNALRRWNLDNLREYWQPLAAEVRNELSGRADDTPVDPEGVAWMVLGPPRLHHTLAHTDIITKPAAGAYLADTFPAYAPLADRAVRWRAGDPVTFTAADLLASAASTDDVAADAWRRFGPADTPVASRAVR